MFIKIFKDVKHIQMLRESPASVTRVRGGQRSTFQPSILLRLVVADCSNECPLGCRFLGERRRAALGQWFCLHPTRAPDRAFRRSPRSPRHRDGGSDASAIHRCVSSRDGWVPGRLSPMGSLGVLTRRLRRFTRYTARYSGSRSRIIRLGWRPSSSEQEPGHARTQDPYSTSRAAKPPLNVLKYNDKVLMVPGRGLEPPRCYPLVPETSASTNSATRAMSAGSGRRNLRTGTKAVN